MSICWLIGHKATQYLQVTESNPDNESWIVDSFEVTKKISTFFLCKRCFHRYKQDECFAKDKPQ